MHARTAALSLSIAAAVVAAGACGASDPVDQIRLEQRLEADMSSLVAQGVPGVVVTITEGEHFTTLVKGERDVVSHAPLQTGDRFRIGSLTKSYTAVVVLQLVGEGIISLDDSVERWLPGLVPGGDRITVGQLLSHTSGLAEYEAHPRYLAPYMGGDPGHVTPPRQLVAYANELGATPVPAGTSRYSNTNFVVAGLIAEKAGGRSLGALMQERIFTPLKLSTTTYPSTPGFDGPHAHGYRVVASPPATDVTGLSPTMAAGAGAVVSTAEDVAGFYRGLFGGKLLRPELLQRMMEARPEGNGEVNGLGVKREQQPCGTAWGHGGNFPGYLVFGWSSPDGDRQAVVAMNMDPSSLSASSGAIEQLVTTAFCGL